MTTIGTAGGVRRRNRAVCSMWHDQPAKNGNLLAEGQQESAGESRFVANWQKAGPAESAKRAE